MELRTFLFDLDGTLIDSIDLILRSLEHTLTVHRGVSPPPEFYLREMGISLAAQFALFTNDGQEVEAMITTYREYNSRHHDAQVRAFTGVTTLLERLKDRAVQTGVVTNKIGSVARRGLRVCGLEGNVDVIIAAEDVTDHKPHPEPVHKALKKLAQKPEHAIMVGDSPLDLVAGRSAGVRTGAALWGPYTREQLAPCAPDYWFSSPVEILDI